MEYVKRHVSRVMEERRRRERIIALTGARQTGKTTLCERQIPGQWGLPYTSISFDDPDERLRFQKAAVPILESLTTPLVILDEVQKFPALFDPLKLVTDRQKTRSDGPHPLFLLTGSSQLLLMRNIRETLAGRAAMCHLYPFSLAEVADASEKSLLSILWRDLEMPEKEAEKCDILFPEQVRRIQNLRDLHLSWGGYPPVWQREDAVEKWNWLRDYRKTYLERDVADVGQVANIDTFAMAQKLLCTRAANILSVSEISRDLSLAVNTVKRYLNLLTISFQCFLLPPYFENVGKRLVKSPKIYFPDTGLMKLILGDYSINQGTFYENWVFGELLKWKQLQPMEPDLFFYRTSGGREIDFLLTGVGRMLPIEVKSNDQVSSADGRNLEAFLKEYTKVAKIGLVVYPGGELVEIRPHVWAIPDWYMFCGAGSSHQPGNFNLSSSTAPTPP
jgi:predicted AAA+ superfamily ATPase